MAEQNIDIFDLSSDFYTDICFHYNSPIDKDITLKDRITLFFPNITLCENGCQIKGMNIETMRAICECKFNNIINNNLFINSAFYRSQVGQIQEILSETNIEIIKCFKEFIKYKYCISCIGGYIILAFIFIQISLTLFYSIKSNYPLRKYIFDITDNFLLYSSKNPISEKTISEPNRKNKSKTHIINTAKYKKFQNNKKDTRRKLSKRMSNNRLLNDISKKDNQLNLKISTRNSSPNGFLKSEIIIDKELASSNKNLHIKTKNKKKIKKI
jgi:hypothetical protein